jgi:Stress responsive A/B Barrel Domain
MIHHLMLLTTKPEVIPTKLEEIMVETRIRLLKIPEVNNLRVGKRVDTTSNPHTCFFSFDVENMDKLAYILENAIYIQFERQILGPFVTSSKVLDYEMEPGKDVRYS